MSISRAEVNATERCCLAIAIVIILAMVAFGCDAPMSAPDARPRFVEQERIVIGTEDLGVVPVLILCDRVTGDKWVWLRGHGSLQLIPKGCQ